jgi:hypothetical protein
MIIDTIPEERGGNFHKVELMSQHIVDQLANMEFTNSTLGTFKFSLDHLDSLKKLVLNTISKEIRNSL